MRVKPRKAMLLAAGRGERMRPLTLTRPKPMLEVQGRPLIEHHIRRLVAAGVEDIIINLSWLGDQIISHCKDGAQWDCRIAYSSEAEPLETAGGIVQALPLLGTAPFLLVNADIWTDYPFAGLLDIPLAAGGARLVLVDNPAHNPEGDFSLAGERVVAATPEALTYAGIGLYDPEFFRSCSTGKQPLLPLLQQAIREKRLYGEHYIGQWTDVGTPERLMQINEGEG